MLADAHDTAAQMTQRRVLSQVQGGPADTVQIHKVVTAQLKLPAGAVGHLPLHPQALA